jgi:hypothetical protein
VNDVPFISTLVPNFDTLLEEYILREDNALGQSPPFSDSAPNSFTEHPDMLLVNELGETVYKLQTASQRERNIALCMRRCDYCKQQHTETIQDCPSMYIARELVVIDGNPNGNPAVMHLSKMILYLLPVFKPMRQCSNCKNVHTEGECPFMLVAREVIRDQNNPAVLHLNRLFQGLFPVVPATGIPSTSAQPSIAVSTATSLPSRPFVRSSMTTTSIDAQT